MGARGMPAIFKASSAGTYMGSVSYTHLQLLAAHGQLVDLHTELLDHLLVNVVAEHPGDVVAVRALDHLLETGGLLVDILDLHGGFFAAQRSVGLFDGVLRDSANVILAKGQQFVEVTANNFCLLYTSRCV